MIAAILIVLIPILIECYILTHPKQRKSPKIKKIRFQTIHRFNRWFDTVKFRLYKIVLTMWLIFTIMVSFSLFDFMLFGHVSTLMYFGLVYTGNPGVLAIVIFTLIAQDYSIRKNERRRVERRRMHLDPEMTG